MSEPSIQISPDQNTITVIEEMPCKVTLRADISLSSPAEIPPHSNTWPTDKCIQVVLKLTRCGTSTDWVFNNRTVIMSEPWNSAWGCNTATGDRCKSEYYTGNNRNELFQKALRQVLADFTAIRPLQQQRADTIVAHNKAIADGLAVPLTLSF